MRTAQADDVRLAIGQDFLGMLGASDFSRDNNGNAVPRRFDILPDAFGKINMGAVRPPPPGAKETSWPKVS
jgi:hypothetical protein